MLVVYISQDGTAPSGISTYGYQVLREWPEARMLLLNADRPPLAAPAEVVGQIQTVAESESHDVDVVARHLRVLIDASTGPVVIMPNTGDTPWSATVRCVRDLEPLMGARIRLLGIVHSDVETQYASAVRHAKFASAWMAVSRHCADELRRRMASVAPQVVHCLPYPVPMAPATADTPAAGTLRIIYLGRLEEPQKRVSRLAAVFAILARRGMRFAATIVGDGPARAALADAIAASPAAASVTFTGALGAAEMAACLRRSDVFLLTSEFEGLPLALLESMAAGVCPVVMQIASGLDDVMTADEQGVITPAGDVDAMAAAIIALDRDRRRLAGLKAAARDRIERDFTPQRHFAMLSQILDNCWAQPPPDSGTVIPDPTADAIAHLVAQARMAGGPFAIYGAGMFGRKLVDACLDSNLHVVAWFDSDPTRSGFFYRGLTCEGPAQVARYSNATFLIGSLEFAEEIAKRIRQLMTTTKTRDPNIIHARSDAR